MSDSLWCHGLQHTRTPCPLRIPDLLKLCPSSRWCHPTISSSVIPFSSCLQSFQDQRLFQCISSSYRWSKHWSFSFSISPSNEYSGLISFNIDYSDLLAAHGTLEFSPTPQFKSINSLMLSFLYSPALTSIHNTGKTIALTTRTFVGKVVSTF